MQAEVWGMLSGPNQVIKTAEEWLVPRLVTIFNAFIPSAACGWFPISANWPGRQDTVEVQATAGYIVLILL
jgi:hypothetical protein